MSAIPTADFQRSWTVTFVLQYRLAKLKQGTMIVYKQNGEVRFGRIIAFGGDEVNIVNDYILVNDYGLSENSVYPTSAEGSAISYPYKVPENCIFVLNEYRSEIADSRTYGGVAVENVEGSVVFIMRAREI